MIHHGLFGMIREHLQQNGKLDAMVQEIMEGRRNPYTTIREILQKWLDLPDQAKEI